jgi:hypothetical protein
VRAFFVIKNKIYIMNILNSDANIPRSFQLQSDVELASRAIRSHRLLTAGGNGGGPSEVQNTRDLSLTTGLIYLITLALAPIITTALGIYDGIWIDQMISENTGLELGPFPEIVFGVAGAYGGLNVITGPLLDRLDP